MLGEMEIAGKLSAIFKQLGFLYVTLDLDGYRQGSMNEALRLVGGLLFAQTFNPPRKNCRRTRWRIPPCW